MRRHLNLLMAVLAAVPHPGRAQQVPDTLFHPQVGPPAYRGGAGPRVGIDEAHFNFHTATGRYQTFARLLRADGYVVTANRRRFTAQSLAGTEVLVIANALGRVNVDRWELPTPSAFTAAEIATVRQWVRRGGALLLIADHMPFPGAAGQLAAAFGITMENGFVTDSASGDGILTFTRSTGLADHPITRGRDRTEHIDSIVAFTGQGFRVSQPGSTLFAFGPHTTMYYPRVSFEVTPETRRESAQGFLQGAAFAFGAGRVAVFGEAAMFSAQLAGPERRPVGMNAPEAPQNAQFALNVMHWLTGRIK